MSTAREATPAGRVRCPMIECRREFQLGRGELAACMHLIASWSRGDMVEAVLWGLEGNRELVIRNLRPPEVDPVRIESERSRLASAAREFAHEIAATDGSGALFGDTHERNRVAFEFAQLLLGPDPLAEGGGKR